jgi:ABC-type sugar transport system ATPase subunit
MESLLDVRRISKRFQGTQALSNVDFTVISGEVHALMGENGAGKSTLSKIIAGVVSPDSGDIFWHRERIDIKSPMHAQQLGIGMVFQELDLFPHLTIVENIAIGNTAAREKFLVHPRELAGWCEGFFQQVGLKVHPGTSLRDLSIGQVQLVAIARALSMNARLLLMDEPTSSLTDNGVESLFSLIAQLKSQGVAIVYVSHKIAEIHRIADRITVLRDGMVIGTRNARDVNAKELIAMMVGRALQQRQRPVRETNSQILLDVRGLSTEFLSDINFQLHAGEVLGLAGLVGAGRSELGAALFGLRQIRGVFRLDANSFVPESPAEAIEMGFCLVPEDRRWEGIFPQMSLMENATIGVLNCFTKYGLLDQLQERSAEASYRSSLSVIAASADIPIALLSGGNQQKVLIARWLMAEPKVLFLDEPTRGIDVGAKEQIYALIDELAAQGKGVILASSELPELFRCCDRIMVLHEGKQAGMLNTEDTSQTEIMARATGVHHLDQELVRNETPTAK